MHAQIATHIPPIRLWQSLCGGIPLPESDYQHVMHCAECETLADEIGEALESIETALRE